MFHTVSELLEQTAGGRRIWEVMLEQEAEVSAKSSDKIYQLMLERYDVMDRAVRRGIEGVESHSGFTGGDAKKLYDYYREGRYLTDRTMLLANCYALATNEVNAAMGVVCATPTAGSSGTLPGVVLALRDVHGYAEDAVIHALFTAGAFGYLIANNAMISGAAGGCQAEVGAASAMAAAAAVDLAGGTPEQSAHAMAMALKNLLGLVCDPVAGLVEVPCIKRNAGGVSIALSAAEMALAGIQSRIPPDEVIGALYSVGLSIPERLRETAKGGLANTPTGRLWRARFAHTGKVLPELSGNT